VAAAHHDHPDGRRSNRAAVRLALAVLAPIAVLTIAAMVWLWPDGPDSDEPWTGAPRVTGDVISVERQPCPSLPEGVDPPEGPGMPTVCGQAEVRLTGGPNAGELVITDIPNGPGAPTLADGDGVVLIHLSDAPSGSAYQIIDHQRGTRLWLLVAAFALAVIAFGRWRGLSALAGLAVTFAVLLLFVVPAILDGRSPLLVAIVGSAAIMLVVLYLTHGFTVPTTAAVLGTLASLTLTGVLSAVTTGAIKLTGVGTEESSFLTIMFDDVNMQGLLLAGILIGSLGVLDDVAVTQAYTVDELARANPRLGFAGLYRGATRVGRAHIASVINTIVLAYAGASLPLMILLAAGNQPLGEVLTSELIAQEVVRSVVGTMGLIAAVPITTALAAVAARQSASRTAVAPEPGPRPAFEPGLDPPSEPARVPAPQPRHRLRLDDLDAPWRLPDDDRPASRAASGPDEA
jgi:uncharacterized membrane protein